MATGKRRDGNTVPLEIITGHLSGGEGAVLLLRDITDRVREDEQRRRLESRMQQQQKTESLGILAGGVAHDFNNLLTVILGNADLVMHDLKGKSELTAHVESIRKAALNAASLCTQLLSYSGQGSYKTEPTDLSGLIRHVERLLEVTLPKGASITYNLADGLPAIEADPPQIQQVLVNLVANAGDALKDQSGSVSGGDVTVATGVLECDGAMADRVFLGESPGKSRCVYLEVSDNGVGMDADTRARMFDPFFTTKFMGRGLGLASVLGIVRAHRGGVDVQSAPGKGTVFRVFFPASAPDGPVT
jgi:signal transduction histidine kinase